MDREQKHLLIALGATLIVVIAFLSMLLTSGADSVVESLKYESKGLEQ